MTRRKLKAWVRAVMAFFFVWALCGIALKLKFPEWYQTYKDLMPLVIAIPAAWLGHCFASRLAYTAQLRTVWSNLATAVSEAVAFTYTANPSASQYGKVIRGLNISVEEVRALFIKVKSDKDRHTFFDYIERIKESIIKLGYGTNATPENRTKVREHIHHLWNRVRKTLLEEFERSSPSGWGTESRQLKLGRKHARSTNDLPDFSLDGESLSTERPSSSPKDDTTDTISAGGEIVF